MTPPFDINIFLENIGGDKSMMNILLGLFVETAETVFAALDMPESVMEDADYEKKWQQQLHLLKGSALNIGATILSTCAAQAEAEGPILSVKQKRARLDLLQSNYDEVKRYIQFLRDNPQ